MKKINLVLLFLFVLPSFLLYSQVVINEVQASNYNVIFDEFGDNDDWFELYNSGNTEIDVAGYVLRDNVDTWAIPLGNSLTKIPAGGYLLFWADDETGEGPFHTNFKLSASNGESLSLYMPDSVTKVDSVKFPPMADNFVYARCPDSQNGWILSLSSTPKAKNTCTITSVRNEKQQNQFIYPTITTGSVNIINPSRFKGEFSVSVYNILGRRIFFKDAVASFKLNLDLLQYGKGIYFININAGYQNITEKILVK